MNWEFIDVIEPWMNHRPQPLPRIPKWTNFQILTASYPFEHRVVNHEISAHSYCVKWQIETKVVKKEHLLKKYFKFPACGD